MIRIAEPAEADTIIELVKRTIETVYPRYYPEGAVNFFLCHHSSGNVRKDLEQRLVYVLEVDGKAAGTVTIRENEIERLFVEPVFQKRGYGSELLDFAEDRISSRYDTIQLDSSLPAKAMYLKRGYTAVSFHQILADNGDYLCYEEMVKASGTR